MILQFNTCRQVNIHVLRAFFLCAICCTLTDLFLCPRCFHPEAPHVEDLSISWLKSKLTTPLLQAAKANHFESFNGLDAKAPK
jgi:hypothetical protein